VAKILVIDDEELMRQTLQAFLRRAGHQVMLAKDGNEGVETFRTARPDLVILDIIMPEKEGIEAIIEIKEIAPDARILAMSGGGRTHDADLLVIARDVGAQRVIRKPFSYDEFTSTVAACLAG